MAHSYIFGAWFAPPIVQPVYPLPPYRPGRENYARWRRYLLVRAAAIRWDKHIGINPTGAMLRDTQAAMHNLRLARSEARAIAASQKRAPHGA
jgi:hypothetical protein